MVQCSGCLNQSQLNISPHEAIINISLKRSFFILHFQNVESLIYCSRTRFNMYKLLDISITFILKICRHDFSLNKEA